MLPEGWVLNIRELRGQHALEPEIASPLSGMVRVISETLLIETMWRDVLYFEVGNMISRIREYEERWA